MGLGLVVGDAPEVWASLGFTVVAGACRVGEVEFVLDPSARKLAAWSLPAVDGLAHADVRNGAAADGAEGAAGAAHPNGIVGLDHLVITTPDFRRTIGAFEEAGFSLRRERETSTYGAPALQGFFKHEGVVLEVVGPASPAGDGAARFWGLAFVSEDLDATAACLGDRLHPPKDAVQEGRRIATLDRAAGSTVPIAVMSR